MSKARRPSLGSAPVPPTSAEWKVVWYHPGKPNQGLSDVRDQETINAWRGYDGVLVNLPNLLIFRRTLVADDGTILICWKENK